MKTLNRIIKMAGLAAVAILPMAVSAATYYVAPPPTGDDDNAGTSAKPFATIQKALDSLTPDNCWKSKVIIAAGTYQIASELTVTSGTFSYTVQSASGDPSDVTIDAQGSSRCFNCTGASTITFKGITFTNGAVTGNGGGVLATLSCSFEDCVFRNCSATGHGGGIYSNDSLDHISNVLVDDCSATTSSTSNGGGICVNGVITGSDGMSTCRIYNCSAGNRGGGVYINGTTLSTVSNCDISCNTASGVGGGGIFGKYTAIRNCTVTNNVCDYASDAQTGGSGIRLLDYGTIDGCLVMSNSFANNCSAYNGGGSAVWLANGSSLVNSAIIGNSGARSVGFQWASSGGVLVSNCLFKSNVARRTDEAGYGGVFALCNLKSDSMITDCRFIDNEASQSGGLMEILMGDSSSSTLRIRNCLMTGNVQTKGGGLILSRSGSGNTQLAIENCTIVSNRVNAGPVVTFWDEAAAQSDTTVSGCAILFNNGKTAFDNTFKASANVAHNCTELSGMSAGNITYDSSKPLFVDLENGDFRPVKNSQLCNVVPVAEWMGDGSLGSKKDLGGGYELQPSETYGVNVVWTDAVPRLYKNLADIGCFEFWLPPTPPGLIIVFR